MDEDYDACDLENWFLAIHAADGQGDHPVRSTARVSVTTLKTTLTTGPVPTLWKTGRIRPPAFQPDRSQPTAMIGRPSPTSCPTRRPARSTSMSITTPMASPIRSGSTWATPAPARRERPALPLFAFMVIGLNGRIPLNKPRRRQLLAGSAPARHPRRAPGTSCQRARPHLCVAERANQGPAIDADPFNTSGIDMPLYKQFPGRQRGDRRALDPASQPGRHAAPTQSDDVRPRADRSPWDD